MNKAKELLQLSEEESVFDLKRSDISKVRDKILVARKLAAEAENMLSHALVSGADLKEEDPLSHITTAIEMLDAAYGKVNADSEWINVIE